MKTFAKCCLLLWFGLFNVTEILAIEENPLDKAALLFKAGDFTNSASFYSEALRMQPENISALIALGRIALFCNHLAEAEGLLARALKLEPGNKDARAAMAELFYRQDRFLDAASFLDPVESEVGIRKLRSFEGQTPYLRDESAASTTLKFVNTDPLPAVRVRVNDADPVYFLIDTGAAEVILDQDYAQQIRAQLFGEQTSTFAGGKAAAYQHGRIDSLTLGDFELRNIPVRVMSTRAFAAAAGGKRIDGIIGTVLLYHFCSTIDYRAEQLVLRAKSGCGSFSSESNTASADFWLAGDHFIVSPGVVNESVHTLLFVDTGLAGFAFTAPNSMLKEANIQLPDVPKQEGIGGGGKVQFVPFTLKDIALGDLKQADVPSLFGPFPESLETKFGFRIGGLISHAFFRSYALTFDFERMKLWVQK